LVLTGEAQALLLAIGAVGRFAGRRDKSLPLLAGRLRDQLLDPQAEAGLAVGGAYLVAPLTPVLAQREPELEARVALGQLARLGHLLRAVEELPDVDAHERRRHHPERRQRGVATADRQLAREDGVELVLARVLLEVGAWVGDRRPEAALGVEVIGVRARLERRSRLGRGDEQCAREVELCLELADRLRVRRVEDVERLLAKRAPQHLRRERRAAHAEEHDRVDPVDDRVRELQQQVDVLAHAPRLVEPAEPSRLVCARPERRVARPDAPYGFCSGAAKAGTCASGRLRPAYAPGVPAHHAAASEPRLARIESTISSNESANFRTPSASSVATTSS